MKIALDISPLKSGHAFRGTGAYTNNLIWALQKYNPQHKYIFITRGKKIPKNVDLVHYPYFDPFFLTLPFVKTKPTVVTIHDLIPVRFMDKFLPGLKGKMKWQIQKLSLKNVASIITDSESSKKDIAEFTLFRKEKIYVIPLAPGEEFKALSKNSRLLVEIKKKYNLPDIFLLYVGDVNWNKNVGGLIKAFKKLVTSEVSSSYTSEVGLVLVGKAFQDETLKETQEINQLIDKFEIANSLLKLGFIPAKDLVAIYNLASVYIQPSFAEGFGLPCLEAMTCGTPVVSADIPVLKEVCGKTAVYVDPDNTEDIAKGILKVLCFDTIKYRSTVEAGLKQAKKFSWEKVAKETVRVYQKIMS